MKLLVEIAGETETLEIERAGERVVARIGGATYELTVREPEARTLLLTHEGRVYECRVEGDAREQSYEVQLGERLYRVALSDPRRLRGARAGGAQAGGHATIVAPMPGKVVRVLVEAGAQVEAGDGVVVVEAMKMQNEMKAPKTGQVLEVRVAAGATVNAGEVLAIIE